jgi:hypothetical protein
MPQFTNEDRELLDTESKLWVVTSLLRECNAGAFGSKVETLMYSSLELAREIREYNDQFEQEDDA